MTNLDDTQPRPAVETPEGHQEASHLDETGPNQAVIGAPDDTNPRQPTGTFPIAPQFQHEPVPAIQEETAWGTWFMLAGVLMLSSCLCISIIGLSSVAGIQDALKSVGTQSASTREAALSTQYALGNDDLREGRYEMAEIRFSAILATMTAYPDVPQKLGEVQAVLSYTPTPSPSLTPTFTPTATPEAAQQSNGTPLPPEQDPAQLYAQAESAMVAGLYEEAIRWFDALVLIDPTYRRAEVAEGRLNAHIAQGRLYLRGRNEDGQDRLAQGVQLINRAAELGEVPLELVYEADFVARYVAARSYIEGGALAQAAEVLRILCDENCDWSYQGVSVRELLARAGG